MAWYVIETNDEPNQDGGYKILNRSELVRCKDCKYAKYISEDYYGCSCLIDGIDSDYVMTVKPDSFCSWGERNDDLNHNGEQ